MSGDVWCHIDGCAGIVLSRESAAGRGSFATAQDGRHWIRFEGSVDNAAVLRRALGEDAGSRSEAAILLALFAERGEAALEAIDGDFAFVFWDAATRRLSACRDRFGLSTLYWREDARGLAVASRMTALLPAAGRRLDVSNALEFLVNGSTEQDGGTLFDGVRQLPPGSVMHVDAATWKPGCAVRGVRRWYSPPTAGGPEVADAEAVDAFRRVLSDAVTVAASTDATTGVLLSGGLDSAAITGLLAECASAPLETYKAYFGLPEHDRSDRVTAVLARTGAHHRGVAVGPRALFDHRNDLLDALEHPYERASVAAHWVVCRAMASDGVRVTLDGVGADEQLGGYPAWLERFDALQRGEAVRGLPALGTMRPSWSLEPGADLNGLVGWIAAGTRELAVARLREERSLVIRSFGELCRHHLLHGALPMLLKFNRDIAAALGQQARSPFMSHRLVELSLRLGDRHKVRGENSKHVLRQTMRELFPGTAALWQGGKRSYSDIEAAWLGGPGLERLRAEAIGAASDWPELLDGAALVAGPIDKASLLRLWRIACFGAWARRFDVRP